MVQLLHTLHVHNISTANMIITYHTTLYIPGALSSDSLVKVHVPCPCIGLYNHVFCM